jgi:molybdopterin converting factor small subunit
MEIRFYANFRTLASRSSILVPDSKIESLQGLLEWLIEIQPEFGPLLLDGTGQLLQDVPIFVNGRNPRLSEAGVKVHLLPDDIISLFSPISSGRMNVDVMRAPVSGRREKKR